MPKTLYDVLDVPAYAADEAIHQRYRQLAKQCHPDTATAGSSERFLEVQAAFEVLGDVKSRQRYDDALHATGGHWTRAAQHNSLEHVKLAADGSFEIAGRRYRPEEALHDLPLARAVVRKLAGPGGVLTFTYPDKTLSYCFHARTWLRRLDRQNQPGPLVVAQPQTDAGPPPEPSFGKDWARESRRRGKLVSARVVAVAAIGLLIAGAACTVFWRPGDAGARIQQARDQELADLEAEQARLEAAEQFQELRGKAAAREQLLAVAQMRLRQLESTAARTTNLAEQLQTRLGEWNTRVTPLWTNKRGQAIAAHPDLVTAFEKTVRAMQLDVGEVAERKELIQTLVLPVQSALRAGDDAVLAFDVNDDLESGLRDLRSGLAADLATVENLQAEIDALLTAAAKSGEVSDSTLEEVVKARDAAEASRLAQQDHERREATRRDYERKRLDQAEADERSKQEADLADEQLASQIAAEKRARETRRQKAGSDEVKKLLAPFLADGNAQPDGTSTSKKGPVSLAALRRSNIMNDDANGIGIAYMLNFLGGRYPDRKAFTSNVLMNLPSTDQDRAREMHRTLIELADELQELGLLAP